MNVYKFKPNKNGGHIPKDDEFWEQSHGMGTNEWTLCSIAPEEWGYTNKTAVKKITCPICLREIAHCKTYKG